MAKSSRRIGIVSDTHGHVANTLTAVAQLAELRVEMIIHCGDIGSVQVVPLFADWPAHFVLGNVDDDESGFRWVVEEQGGTFHGRVGRIDLEGKRIAVIHGDDQAALQSAIRNGEFDLVCTGHTHRRELRHEGRTLVLNPGALYRANPKSFAVVDWPEMSVTFVDLRETDR
jgi:putative phosphoesterase